MAKSKSRKGFQSIVGPDLHPAVKNEPNATAEEKSSPDVSVVADSLSAGRAAAKVPDADVQVSADTPPTEDAVPKPAAGETSKSSEAPVAGSLPAGETAPEARQRYASIAEGLKVADTAAAETEPKATPYAEYGGLERRQAEAQRRREEARKEWERRIEEESNARLALVRREKPQDTTREQRKLRNLAIGQAVGELLGSLFGGIYGLGSSGRGYVPKMPGMYRSTLERLQRLQDNDVEADRRFRGLLGSMLVKDAGSRTAMARERYRDEAAAEKQVGLTREYADREAARAASRADLSAQQARSRSDLSEQQAAQRDALQRKRHEQRMAEQRNQAQLKSGLDGVAPGEADEIAYLTKLLLPKKRTTEKTGGKFPTTTVKDATSYNKQEVAAAAALAKQLAPIRRRHALTDNDIEELQEAMVQHPLPAMDWQQIGEALDIGYSVDEILLFISRY